MIENKSVTVLSRLNDPSLVKMVEKMAADGITTYKNLMLEKDWNIPYDELDEKLSGHFKGWPQRDIGQGFINLMNENFAKSREELGIYVSKYDFDIIKDRFLEKTYNDTSKPREKWQNIVSQFPDSKDELMRMANRTYHYNFGLCLQGDTFRDDNVFVNSIANPLFGEKTIKPIETDSDLSKLSFKIPQAIIMDKLFVDAIAEGSLANIQKEFYETNIGYISGDFNSKDLRRIQDAFAGEIKDFDKKRRESLTWQDSWEFVIDVGVGAAEYMEKNDPTNLVVAVTKQAPKVVNLVKNQFRYIGKQTYTHPLQKGMNIDSLQIDATCAADHITPLKSFE